MTFRRRPFLVASLSLVGCHALLFGCGETKIEIVHDLPPLDDGSATGGQSNGPRIACVGNENCPGPNPLCVDSFCVCDGPCEVGGDGDATATGGTTGDGDGDATPTGGTPGDGDGDAMPTGGTPGDGDGDGDAPETGGSPGDGDGDGDQPMVANLITNGDFESGTAGWEGGDGPPTIEEGKGCRDGGTYGWQGSGTGMNIPAGSYTFSFKLSGEGDGTVKVAGAVEPWEPVLLEQSFTAGSELQEFSFPVTVDSDASQIGIAIMTSGGRSCLDDVTLTAN